MADYNSAYTGVQIDANLALAATATQPGDLGTAAFTASTAYATAAQGTLANSATQPGDDAADLGSGSATDGYVLTADGAGGAAWEAASGGGGTPGGSDTQVQFNDGGAFGGDSGFTFDKTNNTLGITGATITASDPIIDMAQTWNNGAVAFTAVKANVTDTASAAASLLMDLQVGGVSRTSIAKDGAVYTFGGYRTQNSPNTVGFEVRWGASFPVASMTSTDGTGTVTVDGGGAFRFGSGALTVATPDVFLRRDAANTLAQRNGVNAQAFNLYNRYDTVSDYDRGFMRWSSNVLQIGTEKAGTSITARALEFHTNGINRLDISADGIVTGRTGYFYNLSSSIISIWALQGGVNNWIGNQSNHAFSLRTNNTNRITLDTTGSVQITTALTVATLPATPLVGMMARVTDATTPTVGSTVTGGGAANALCWYNGTNWTVIGA